MIEFTAIYWFVVGFAAGLYFGVPSKAERDCSSGNNGESE